MAECGVLLRRQGAQCRECRRVEAVLCDERNIYIAVTVAKPAMSEAADEIQPFAELRPI